MFLFLTIFMFGQRDSILQAKCILSPDTYNEQPIYRKVDKMPEYQGGIETLMRLIAKNIIYSDRNPNNKSVIHTTFVIDTLGKAQNICTITDKSELDNQEKQIVEVLKSAQNWTAGILNDKKVCVRITIPVRICLK